MKLSRKLTVNPLRKRSEASSLQLTVDRKTKRQLSVVSCQLFSAGQSLLEVVVAVAIVAALATALVAMSLFTQKTSRSTASNTQASKLVQQNIEQMRIFRDRNGLSALPADGNCYILKNTAGTPDTWILDPCDASTPNGKPENFNNVTFLRRIAISEQSPNKKKVVVSVSWTDSSGLQTVSNTTILTDLSNVSD